MVYYLLKSLNITATKHLKQHSAYSYTHMYIIIYINLQSYSDSTTMNIYGSFLPLDTTAQIYNIYIRIFILWLFYFAPLSQLIFYTHQHALHLWIHSPTYTHAITYIFIYTLTFVSIHNHKCTLAYINLYNHNIQSHLCQHI